MALVPPQVLAGFGVDSAVRPLDGGQGTSVRVGDLVLKPNADPDLVAWASGLCTRLDPGSGFRLPAPVPARDGRLVVDGWCATAYADGASVHDDDTSAESWERVLAAGRVFHAAASGEPPPAFAASRTDRWAAADRAAWGEPVAAVVGSRSAPLLHQSLALVADEGLPDQLVHGDLSGNVLLDGRLPPAIIDVSPYWRPAAYADAVVVIDALLWWRTDPALIARAAPHGVRAAAWRSLLARALVFRLLAFDEPRRSAADVADQLPRYAEVLALLSA